ncbi:MAG TPA: hypothetical protein VGX23_01485 [Actinocrinis sp.]|nr:hypothetical protein [Actinocrinis sp.]
MAQSGQPPTSLSAGESRILAPYTVTDQDATRYLCSAAHLDQDFTRSVVREVLVAEHRLPIPVPGVDLSAVIRHCLAARARLLYRDCTLVAVLLVAVGLAGWATAAWYTWLAGLWLALRAARTGSARNAAMFGVVMWVLVAAVVLALALTRADPFGLRAALHIAEPTDTDVACWLGAPILAIICCWAVVVATEIATSITLAERLARGRFTPSRWLSPEPAWAQHALAVLGERLADGRLDRHPVADPSAPFVGSGRAALRKRWLIDLGPAGSRSAPFDTGDLLDRICESLADGEDSLDLITGSSARVNIDSCAISTGAALATSAGHEHEEGRPAHTLGRGGEIRLIPDPPSAFQHTGGARAARPFRRIRICGDPAGLVVTGFLSASSGAGVLQVELYGHVLGPIAARYRKADRSSGFGWATAAGCVARGTSRLPYLAFTAPRSVCRTAADPLLRRRHRATLVRAAQAGLSVDAGARFSVREAAAAPVGADRFADEDANLYLAFIERRVREELRPLLPSAPAEF